MVGNFSKAPDLSCGNPRFNAFLSISRSGSSQNKVKCFCPGPPAAGGSLDRSWYHAASDGKSGERLTRCH